MHQGDLDGAKGVYPINAVDCVVQMQFVATFEKISELVEAFGAQHGVEMQFVATFEKISEAYLLLVIRQLLDGFPFVILGFHSDNGSEYINYQVAKLLEKLRVELTQSRPRHSNDNCFGGVKERRRGTQTSRLCAYPAVLR